MAWWDFAPCQSCEKVGCYQCDQHYGNNENYKVVDGYYVPKDGNER